MTIQNRLTADKEKVVNRYLKGEGPTKIAKDYNCNGGTVWWFLNNLGLIKRTRKDYPDEVELTKKMIDMYCNQNIPCYKISKILNIDTNCIFRWLQKAGIKTNKFSTIAKKVDLDDKLIVNLYINGDSATKIAKQYNVNSGKIWKILNKNGIKLRSVRKYHFNQDYFEKIDSHEKAYCLGFFMADGNNRTKRDGIRMEITDLEILQKIAKCFNYDGPLIPKPKRKEHHKIQYSLGLHSGKLSSDFEKLGCPPNKTFLLKFPDDKIVSKEFFSSLIRGYFDGDGSIGCKGRFQVCVIGTRHLLEGIVNLFPDINFHFYQRYPERKKDNWTLMCWKEEDVKQFLDFIYKDSTIYMGRKFKRYLNFLEYCKLSQEIKLEKENLYQDKIKRAVDLHLSGLSCHKVAKMVNIERHFLIIELRARGIYKSGK